MGETDARRPVVMDPAIRCLVCQGHGELCTGGTKGTHAPVDGICHMGLEKRGSLAHMPWRTCCQACQGTGRRPT